MRQPLIIRRLAFAALWLTLCLGGWLTVNHASAAPLSSSVSNLASLPGAEPTHESVARTALRTVAIDFDGDGDTDQVALHAEPSGLSVRVWLNDGLGRLAPMAVANVATWQVRELHVTIDETSTTDNSDQSDAAAHVEPRAGPVSIEPSRAAFAVVHATPRTRPHFRSSPRAPPILPLIA